jgi:hypothetical protein
LFHVLIREYTHTFLHPFPNCKLPLLSHLNGCPRPKGKGHSSAIAKLLDKAIQGQHYYGQASQEDFHAAINGEGPGDCEVEEGACPLESTEGDAVVESKETKQVVFGGAKATKEKERVEVIERERSVDQQPKIKSPVAKIADMAVVERRRSASQTDNDDDSQTAVITVDQGRRRRSSAYTSSTRSSTDSVELRREPRYHSPRTSKDLGRRDFCVVQVTEPLPRTRQGSKEVTRFREVTVYRKEARYTAVH